MAQFTLRIPDDTHSAIGALAVEDEVTMNQFITLGINEYLAQRTAAHIIAQGMVSAAQSLQRAYPMRSVTTGDSPPRAPIGLEQSDPTWTPHIEWQLTMADVSTAISALHPIVRWRNKAALHETLERTNHLLSTDRKPRTIALAAATLAVGFAAQFPLSENNVGTGFCLAVSLLNLFDYHVTYTDTFIGLALHGLLERATESSRSNQHIIESLADVFLEATAL